MRKHMRWGNMDPARGRKPARTMTEVMADMMPLTILVGVNPEAVVSNASSNHKLMAIMEDGDAMDAMDAAKAKAAKAAEMVPKAVKILIILAAILLQIIHD